jgi:Protein of unknown function (DUF1822)
MTYNAPAPDQIAITLPITSRTMDFAQQFAQQQATPLKHDRVGLNTIAVCTVRDYLQMIGFETNLESSESWNRVARMAGNFADLDLGSIGKLECIPVSSEDRAFAIPAEVWLDRIGYVFVEVNVAAKEATIRGFVTKAQAEVRPERLRSPEDLIDRLHTLQETPLVRLDRWLGGIEETIATGWQSLESLLNTPELAFRAVTAPLRPNVIQRAKIVDLGIQLYGNQIALVAELSPREEDDFPAGTLCEQTTIRLRVVPVNQITLVENLQLLVLDEDDETFLEAKSRNDDSLIQLEFSGTPGERFTVIVKLGSAEVMEQFTI